MKLYYLPGACSLSPHIVANEAGIAITLDKVDRATRITASGENYPEVNPKGYVPALRLDDSEVLTEGPVIVQYLADLKPESGLAPPHGTLARYRLQEILTYINSELHKTYSPLFNPATPEETRAERIAYLKRRYAYIEGILGKQPYLLGERFTVADAYLFTVTQWAPRVDLDLGEFPALAQYQRRIAERPSVQDAMRIEGLLK
jgi:glutathione S-transferase